MCAEGFVGRIPCARMGRIGVERGEARMGKAGKVIAGGAAAGVEPLLSEKDKKHPAFDTAKKYFSADASSWLGE